MSTTFSEDQCSTVSMEKEGPWNDEQYVEIEHSGPDDVTLSFVQLTMTNRNLFHCIDPTGGKIQLLKEQKRLTCFMRNLY